MSFQARYPGQCANCEGRIHLGDFVEYDDDELVHSRCPVSMSDITVGPREVLCGRCFTFHAGECI